MTTALRSSFAILTAFLLSFGVGVLTVANNEWFGSGDLYPYAIWCAPFAIFLWCITSLYFRTARGWPSCLAAPVGLMLGAVAGFVGTYAVAVVLGPWFGAMSVPILKSWCLSASIFVPAVYFITLIHMRRQTTE